MAFQLLTFFILTFRPSAIEGQILLHMPPPHPVTALPDARKAGMDANSKDALEGLNTMVVTVIASPSGQIDSLSLGDVSVSNVSALAARLKTLLADPQMEFDEVLIQAGSTLSYQSLMDVVEACTQQKLRTGDRLSKLGFAEIPSP